MKTKLHFTLFLFSLFFLNYSFSQTQIGIDIDGEAAWVQSGNSVSLSTDGSRMAIGASKNNENGGNTGHVRIYEFDGASWSQLGADIDGESSGDRSGSTVSLSANGSRVAIGAPENDDNGGSSGHVRIYEYDGSLWSQLGTDIDGEAEFDQSGRSVSLNSDGSIVAIGANGNDENGNFSGHVRVYNYDGTSWSQLGTDIDGEATGDISGWSVSLNDNGTIIAIGAPDNDDNGNYSGHVRVYEYNGASWSQIGGDIDGEGQSDNSGISVSLNANGTIIAIGAHLNNGNGTDSGHVRIYEFNGMDWSQIGNDIDGEAEDDLSGSAVSLSADGSRIAIGAEFNIGNGTNSGHVRVYDLSGLLSTSDVETSLIYIGPNPMKEGLLIHLKDGNHIKTVNISDITGKLILTSTNTSISTSHLESGLYLVKITTDKGSFIKKLIKN